MKRIVMTSREFKGQSGMVMVVCLIILLMLSLIGISSITTSNTDMMLAGITQQSDAAFYLADAGAEKTIATLNHDRNWRDGFDHEALGHGYYEVTVVDSVSNPALGEKLLVTSTGLVQDATKTVEIKLRPEYLSRFRYAAFGRDSLTISSTGLADSYDSDNGTYASQAINGPDSDGNMYASSGGDIGSNGEISLQSGTQVHGDGSTSQAGGIDMSSGSIIYGDTTDGAPPDPPDPIPPDEFADAEANNDASSNLTIIGDASYNSSTNQLYAENGSTVIFGSGTYYFSSVDFVGGSILQIAPGANVRIYVGGNWNTGSGAIVNTSQIPSNLLIYCSGSEVTLSGGTSFYGAIYAPDAKIDVSSGGRIYGSLIGRTVDVRSGSHVHYDEALSRMQDSFVGYTIDSWREL